jgi:hypothetical protein
MNMQNLMAQAQKIQRDIQKKKEELDKTEYEGNSEWVKVVLLGDKTIKSIKITKDSLPDAEDVEMLQDMIKIAFDDACKKVDKDYEDKMGMYANMGGLM